MAKFRGNIWTKAAGSIGSITFSKARNRDGKIQTARERVAPLNPQTPAQMSARDNMSDSTFIVTRVLSSDYATRFDRTTSKLPAYQSLISKYQRAKSVVGTDIVVDSRPNNISGGPLAPAAIGVVTGNPDGTYQIPFVRGGGDINPADELIIGAITRVMPLSEIETFRFEDFSFSNNPSSPVMIDMGGFPTQDSGILFFSLFQNDQDYQGKVFSPVTWSLFTP